MEKNGTRGTADPQKMTPGVRDSVGDVLDGVGDVGHTDVKQLVRQELVHRVEREARHGPRHHLRSNDVQEGGQKENRVQVVQGSGIGVDKNWRFGL
jgi:hypothetical protein